MIDLTPLEVRKKKGDFKRTMRGYDPELVDDFLDLVADRMEELVRDVMSLTERVTRSEQAVAEYRERERALTDALVTAQEMREEVRRQATKEAELALRSAQQEAAALRSSAEQETSQLRSSAEQESAQLRSGAERAAAELRSSSEQAAAQLRSSAEQAAAQLRAAAEQEAAQLRASALQESTQLRTSAQQEAALLVSSAQQAREREEAAAARLRTRQEQVFSTYQSYLERELAELRAMAQSLGIGAVPSEARTVEPAPAPAALAAPAPTPPQPAQPMPSMPPLGAPVGGFAAGTMLSSASMFEMPSDDVDVFNEPDLDDALVDAGILQASDVGLDEDDPTAAELELVDEELPLLDDELPPFEPEPLAPEDMPAPQNELELYDGLAAAEPGAGVPGAVGLGGIVASTSWSSNADWKVPGISLVPEGGAPLEEPEVDDEDEETARLLRNAAAAGYRLPDEDELLLDEAVDDDVEPVKDGGWLPSLLDDDRDDRFDA